MRSFNAVTRNYFAQLSYCFLNITRCI